MQGLPQIGDILDETYRIESLLGQGGFGAVYLAKQLSMDRLVAIKVLVAHAMNVEEMATRFRREVMAIRNLEHPNTIRVYDFKENEDGILYYSMEYVRGKTLKDMIVDDGAAPERRARHILRQVLKSLSEAHSHGIIHRDLKPANIMLADLHGEQDYVKVVDFGIAKILDKEEEEDAAPLTSAGVLVGTLQYMSPEQITGADIGPYSDLYALGLIGIEMLAGKSVFAGSGRWDVLHKQISDDAVEIPENVIQMPLGQILAKAVSKKVEDRFATALEMLQALDEATGNTSGERPMPNRVVAPTPAPIRIGDGVDAGATQMSELPEGVLPVLNTPAAAPAPVPQPVPMPATQSGPDSASGSIGFVASPFAGGTGQMERDELFEEPSTGSNKGLILGVIGILALVLVAGGLYVMSLNKDTEVAEPEEPIAVIDPVVPDPVVEEPIVEEPKVDEPVVEVKSAMIRIETPGTKARVYEEDTFVGTTPVRLEIASAKSFSLRAEGYIDELIELSPESEPTMEVQMHHDRSGAEDAKETKDTRTKDKPKDKPKDDGWVSVKKDPKKVEKKVEKKNDKKKDTGGWVDLKKKEEKKKKEVPLF